MADVREIRVIQCTRCGLHHRISEYCACLSEAERKAIERPRAGEDPILAELRAIRELLEQGAGRPVLNVTLGESIVSDQVLADAIGRLTREQPCGS